METNILELIVSDLNYNIIRIDKTLSILHVIRQFAENSENSSLIIDSLQGVSFLMLDALSELESLRDSAQIELQGDE